MALSPLDGTKLLADRDGLLERDDNQSVLAMDGDLLRVKNVDKIQEGKKQAY